MSIRHWQESMPTTPRRRIPITVYCYAIEYKFSNLSYIFKNYAACEKYTASSHAIYFKDALEFVIQSNVSNDPIVIVQNQRPVFLYSFYKKKKNSSILDYLVHQL